MDKYKANKQDLPTTNAGGFRITDVESTIHDHVGDEKITILSPESTTNVPEGQDNLKVPPTPQSDEKPVDTFEQLVLDTMNGKYGSGRERMLKLGKQYAEVQKEITKRIRSSK